MTATETALPDGMSLPEAERMADAKLAEGRALIGDAARLYSACARHRADPYREGSLRRKRWQAERALGLHALFASEAGQDRFLHESVFGERRRGSFVEVGGYDGRTGSNCLFFEAMLDWEGVVVEASPSRIESIRRSRKAKVIHAAIAGRSGEADFLEVLAGYTQMSGLLDTYPPELLERVRRNPKHREAVFPVRVMTLSELLDECGLVGADYCSIDIEGAERVALEALDLARAAIRVFSVENNRADALGSVADLLVPAGYGLETVIGADEIYVRR
jgi:FkbM family methyltransferase